MRRNLFEEALSRGEASKFFKGEGLYFLRNPETGGHSTNVHMSGWVANYVAGESERMAEFCTAFNQFVADAEPASKDDFFSVLENLFSYVSVSKKGLFPGSDFLKYNNSETVCSLRKFAEKVKFQKYFRVSDIDINFYMDYFERNGYPLLSNLFREEGV